MPGPYGIGDFGPQAFAWIDLLAGAGQRWWQMLPLGPPGEGNSPYRCFSAFAGNPLLISPDLLVEDGLLVRSDLRGMLPGMRVLQFAFGEGPGNPHLPHNFVRHCFAYTGTHDNDTTLSWYRTLSIGNRYRLYRYAPDLDWKTDPVWSLIRILYSSVANDVLIPAQDLLGLDHSARMNTRGKANGNWEWRLSSLADCMKPLTHLARLCCVYERTATPKPTPFPHQTNSMQTL